jgi:hypothetical protein
MKLKAMYYDAVITYNTPPFADSISLPEGLFHLIFFSKKTGAATKITL